MAKKEYFGMCIGGPLAGSLLASKAPAHNCLMPFPMGLWANIESESAPDKAETHFTYVYQTWHFDGMEAGVWTEAGMSATDTFNAILAGYSKSCDKEKP